MPVGEAASDRRAHERHTVSSLEWLSEARLKYGPGVSLIDLSVGGAQIETQGHRLHPGSTLVIELAARHAEFAIPARVIRCHVSQIAPQTTFRGALEFKRPFAFPETRPASPSLSHDNNPLHEHARLTATLRRLAALEQEGSASTALTGVSDASLSAALAVLESPAGRRGGNPFASELGRLFGVITRALETNGWTDLAGDLAERLRRVVPAQSIRVVDPAALPPHGPDAVKLAIASPTGAARMLLVEFPRGCRLEEWHLQFLKAASHVVAFANDISEARARAEAQAQRASSEAPLGWHRLVVRYNDGRMLKGFGRDFYPAKGQVHVWQRPDGPPQSRISVQLSHLKAVFFVHDFDGATSPEPASAGGANSGRLIDVTFVDGELLSGRTLNYAGDGPGFFMTPVDNTTNNHRIFVVNNAVRSVQFP